MHDALYSLSLNNHNDILCCTESACHTGLKHCPEQCGASTWNASCPVNMHVALYSLPQNNDNDILYCTESACHTGIKNYPEQCAAFTWNASCPMNMHDALYSLSLNNHNDMLVPAPYHSPSLPTEVAAPLARCAPEVTARECVGAVRRDSRLSA